MDAGIIKRYIEDFKRIFSRFTKDGVTISTVICPYKGGIVLIFQFNTDNNDSIITKKVEKNVFDIFDSEGIDGIISIASGSDRDGIVFTGTNIANMGNRLVLIKDESLDEWGITAVVEDVSRIIGKAGNNGK